MAWVAVDYGGGEYVYDYKPIRRGYLTWGAKKKKWRKYRRRCRIT